VKHDITSLRTHITRLVISLVILSISYSNHIMSANEQRIDETNQSGMQPSQTSGSMASTTGGGGDMLDKGVDFAEKQMGHEQVSAYISTGA
jgi:hypothetical protein